MISLVAATPMAIIAAELASRVMTCLGDCFKPSDALLNAAKAAE